MKSTPRFNIAVSRGLGPGRARCGSAEAPGYGEAVAAYGELSRHGEQAKGEGEEVD